jgi:hypothetical protein
MSLLQSLVALGDVARVQAGIGLDLPVGQAVIDLGEAGSSQAESLAPLQDLLAEMIRAARVEIAAGTGANIKWRLELVDHVVERGTALPAIQEALDGLSPDRAAEMAQQLRSGLSVGLEVGAQTVTLLPDEVGVGVIAGPGWIAAEASGWVVALDLA